MRVPLTEVSCKENRLTIFFLWLCDKRDLKSSRSAKIRGNRLECRMKAGGDWIFAFAAWSTRAELFCLFLWDFGMPLIKIVSQLFLFLLLFLGFYFIRFYWTQINSFFFGLSLHVILILFCTAIVNSDEKFIFYFQKTNFDHYNQRL